MWCTINYLMIGAFFAVMIGIEILRPLVHNRRVRRDGIGSSQDVALWGMLIACATLIAGAIAAVLCWLTG